MAVDLSVALHFSWVEKLNSITPNYRLCDGYVDCDGGEDEANCGCPALKPFFCAYDESSIQECIESDKVCDGVSDCTNGHDEKVWDV